MMFLNGLATGALANASHVAVVPILVGPLQALLALLPAILVGLGGLLAAACKPRTIGLLFKLLWRQKWVVVPAVAVVALGWRYFPRWLPPGTSGSATFAEASGYTAFRGGPDRRGWIPGAPDPTLDARHWSQSDPHATFYSSPAIVGDYAFVVSAQVSLFSLTGTGRIQCLNAHTGQRVWLDRIADLRATFSSPAVEGDYLVVGEGLHFTSDARVICLDSRTGATRWTYRTRSHVESSPAIADGRVFVGAGDDGLYCFALEPDEAGQARVLWHKSGERYLDCEASPAVYDGRVYMGLGFYGNALVCLDAATGDELWRTETPYPIFGSPTIHQGRLYVGMGNGNFVFTAEQIWEAEQAKLRSEGRLTEDEIEALGRGWQPGGAVWRLDRLTGAKIWAYETPRTVLGSVVANEGQVFFGTRDGFIHKLSAQSGELERRWSAGAPLLASPALAEEHVYFVSNAGVLFALRQDTLEPVFQSLLWSTPPGTSDYFLSSPTVAHGRLYVGTPASGVLALGEPGRPPPPTWSGRRGGPGYGGVFGGAVVPRRMRVAARYPDTDDDTLAATGPIALGDDQVYVPYRQKSGGETTFGLLALSLGGAEATGLSSVWNLPLAHPMTSSPVLWEGILYGLSQGDETDEARLHAIAAEDGRLIWSHPYPDAIGEWVVADSRLLFRETPNRLVALPTGSDKAPTPAWRFDAQTVGVPHASGQRVALAAANPDELILLDLATGRPLWRVPLPATPISGPVIRGGRVFVASAIGVDALSMLDGSPLWQTALADVTQPLILAGDWLLAQTDNHVVPLDLESGELHGQFSSAPISPLVAGEGVYLLGSRGFIRGEMRQPDARPDVWMRWNSSQHGDIRQAPVISNGRLILTTDRGIVVADGEETIR